MTAHDRYLDPPDDRLEECPDCGEEVAQGETCECGYECPTDSELEAEARADRDDAWEEDHW